MFTSALRGAAALLVLIVIGVGAASGEPAPDDETRVATAALHALAEALVPVSGLSFRSPEVTLVTPPEPVVPPSGQAGAHVLRFADVRIVDGNRFLSAAPIDVIILRLSDDLFEVRVQLPSLMDHLISEAYIGAVTFADHAIRGVWSDGLRMFVELEVAFSGVRLAEAACDAACVTRLAGLGLTIMIPEFSSALAPQDRIVGSVAWRYSLTEQETGRWSGLADFTVADLRQAQDRNDSAQSIGQISMQADVRSVALTDIRRLADGLRDSDTERPLGTFAIWRLLEDIPPLLDGGSITLRLSDLVYEDAGLLDGPGSERSPDQPDLERLAMRVAIDGLSSETSQMQISLAYSAPGLSERQGAETADIVPEILSLSANVEDIPSEHAWMQVRQRLLVPLLQSRRELQLAVAGSMLFIGADPAARWSVGPVRAEYVDWALGIEGTMSLTGQPGWDVAGAFDLRLENIDRPISRLPDNPVPWLRERGLMIAQALRDIALPGPEPGMLTVRIDMPAEGDVSLNGHSLESIVE